MEERKTALVTGASRGIGKAVANRLVQEGYHVILVSHSSYSDLLKITKELNGGKEEPVARCVSCDVGNPDEVRKLFSSIRRLDLLVNNAGIAYIGLLQEMSDEDWNRILSTNLSSVFYTSRSAIPLFLHQEERGRIINISSVWGNVGASCEAAYSATKGGVNALTHALAKELAPSGIPVNAIACGCVDTVMNAQLNAEEKQELCEEIPAGRFATPDEIAEALMHLVHAPAYLTGQIITVDGGWI